jgi:hypothetical protein
VALQKLEVSLLASLPLRDGFKRLPRMSSPASARRVGRA